MPLLLPVTQPAPKRCAWPHLPRFTVAHPLLYREPPLATKRIALRNPVYNESLCKGLLEELVAELLDTPLPPLQECLHVKLYF